MDDILRRIVVSHARSILADRDKVVADLLEEDVDIDVRLLVIHSLKASVRGGAVLLQ